MSDVPQGPGWWLASDGKYYPPQPAQPVAGAPEQPVAGAPTYQVQPPGSSGFGAPMGQDPMQPTTGGGSSSTKVVLIVVGVLVALLLVVGVLTAVVIAARDDDSGTVVSDQRDSPTAVVPGSGGSEPVAPDPSDLEVTETGMSIGRGYDDGPSATAGAVVVNEGDSNAAFVEVVFTFKDKAGKAVGTDTGYVDAIDPGGTAYVAVDYVSLQADAATVDAAVIPNDGYYSGTVVPVTVGSVAREEYNGVVVKGTATNPTSEVLESVGVQCVLRFDGRIVGGVSASLDTMVANAEVAWESYGTDEWVKADAAECSAGQYD